MARGLVVGRVFNGQSPVKGATVSIRRITTPSGEFFEFESAEVSTNSKGQFGIPFAWSGSQFANDLSVIDILLIAYKQHIISATSRQAETGRTNIRGYLVEDAANLFGIPVTNIFQAVHDRDKSDLLGFALDFSENLKYLGTLLYLPKVAFAVTESWLIIGAGNIFTH